MEGSRLHNLHMFRKLCGDGAMRNVLLTTTQWSNVSEAVGTRREAELLSNGNFWGELVANGARMKRYGGDRDSGLALIASLMKNNKVPLRIQHELVDQRMELQQTTAGEAINEDLIRMQKKHEEDMRAVKEELREALKDKDKEQLEILEKERQKLKNKLGEIEAERKRLEGNWEDDYRIQSQQGQERVGGYLAGTARLPGIFSRDGLHSKPDMPILLIHAKMALEIGNIGVSGELFFQKLTRALPGQVAVQGAGYNGFTALFSYRGGFDSGVQEMVDGVNRAIMVSPAKKIILSGTQSVLRQFFITNFGSVSGCHPLSNFFQYVGIATEGVVEAWSIDQSNGRINICEFERKAVLLNDGSTRL